MNNVAEKKAVVADFIARCNDYAEAMLARYRAELGSASGMTAVGIQDKIGHWTAYRAFNEHTLGELATARLDDWFR
jgi:hypothetical protein